MVYSGIANLHYIKMSCLQRNLPRAAEYVVVSSPVKAPLHPSPVLNPGWTLLTWAIEPNTVLLHVCGV